MIDQSYKDQVDLLLTVLPEVAKENNLAMHGGTAINLFIRDMPRVSVDIDLTYVPIEDRDTTLANIHAGLGRIKKSVENLNQGIRAEHRPEHGKLLIARGETIVKLEINLVMRGLIAEVQSLQLCQKVQDEFDAFVEMAIVPKGQLYGGKLCAALDRQHPRDLFDVKYILEKEGYTAEIKTGFLYCLLSSARPLHEILSPQLLDQQQVMQNQFDGMSEDTFTYKAFEEARQLLIDTIQQNLTAYDKEFLLRFKGLIPEWSQYDFLAFPSVRWKLQNLERLKAINPDKYSMQYKTLHKALHSMQ